MRLGNLIPLLVLGFIAWHSQATVKRTLRVVGNLKGNFVGQQQLTVILESIKLANLGDDTIAIPQTQAGFQAYLRRVVNSRTGADPSLDPWGVPYRYRLVGSRLTIISAGPDRMWNSADDLSQSIDLVQF